MKILPLSLRTKITLAVIIPVIATLIIMSYIHNVRERKLFEEQLQLYTTEIGGVIYGSLQHALLSGDEGMMRQILNDVKKITSVRRVQILNTHGKIIADSLESRVGTSLNFEDPGCYECHHIKNEPLPNSIRLGSSPDLLRVILPIRRKQECIDCLVSNDPEDHLGILLIDISMAGIDQHLFDDFRVNLALLVSCIVLLVSGLYFILNRLLVQRLKSFQQPLAQFAAGDLAVRIHNNPAMQDELSNLADTFNRMAQEIEHHLHDKVKRANLRQQAIIAERERLARELHDNLAQLLGYVKTKASAARVNLENNQPMAAIKNLRQLEEAAQDLLMDVREAILNLRMSAQLNSGLSASLELFTKKYTRFSGLPVELTISPDIDSMLIDTEIEMQLLRIVQEAMSNIRKHALAKHVWIDLVRQGSSLILTIKDDGFGFDPERTQSKFKPSYGLAMMRERAVLIGAQFQIQSGPNEGSKIILKLSLNGDNHHEDISC